MGVGQGVVGRHDGGRRLVEPPTPRRGEIWWAAADKRRPVLVVQADSLNRTAIGWFLAVPLTSNLALGGFPGNVRLSRRQTKLAKPSVANLAQTAPVPRFGFREHVSTLSPGNMTDIDSSLRLVFGL